MNFYFNPKVHFLPVEVHLKFPNLVVYNSFQCSVKTISKKNFKSLKKLAYLELNDNLIESIPSNTFEDLISLVQLNLKRNKIKQLNTKAFSSLKILAELWLDDNECIDDSIATDAFDSEVNKQMMQVIEKNCSFSEELKPLFNFECGETFCEWGVCNRIVGGSEMKRGEWPFLVALYHVGRDMFFCGGTLITNQHILTAAHCIRDKYFSFAYAATDIVILLGRNDVSKIVEQYSTTRDVSEIHVNPEWKLGINEVKWDADIAILVMDEPVKFSKFIQPACLPKDSNIENFPRGTVVGWGMTEHRRLSLTVPKRVNIYAVNDSYCYTNDYVFGMYSSLRTFCAGGNNIGACEGDSGGGFFVRINGSWNLRGIVSMSLFNKDRFCDVGRYTIFTKVLDFMKWIQDVVGQNY